MRLTSHSETGPSPFDDLILLTGESSRENASSYCITQTVNQTGTSKKNETIIKWPVNEKTPKMNKLRNGRIFTGYFVGSAHTHTDYTASDT